MEQQASHFQIVDGEVALGVVRGLETLGDVWGPLDPPHNGVELGFATEPHTACAPLAGITEAHKVRPAGDKLGALGGPVGHQFHDCQQVLEGPVGIAAFGDLDCTTFGPW